MTEHKPSHGVPIPGLQDRLAVFLQKAAPILAAERGLTLISRLKLEAVAGDLGMSAVEFEDALRNTQDAPSEPTPPPVLNDPQSEVYRIYLRKKLAKLVHGILTPDQERRLISIAWKRHTIPEPEARQLIQEVSAELGQRRISLGDAESHVHDFIAKQLADVTWVDQATAERLILAGQTWGLQAERVDAMIRDRADFNRQQRTHTERWNRIIYSFAGIVFVVLIAALGGWALFRGRPERATSDVSATARDAASKATPAGPVAAKPTWWDYDLALAIARARVDVAGFGSIYDHMRSAEPAERGAAYEQILVLARKSPAASASDEVLRDLVIGLHALEPDDKTAARLRGSLLALALVARRELPAGPADYRLAFWSVRVALAGLHRAGLPPPRAEALTALLERTLGVAVEPLHEFVERERRCLAALAKLLFRQLTSGAAAQPALALDLHSVLTRFAARCLDVDELERLDVKFVIAALPAVGESWLAYEDLIAQCAGSKDAALVLQMVDLLERLAPGGLREFLAGALLARVGVRGDAKDVELVARAVREALGARSPAVVMSTADRWKELRPRVDAALVHAAKPMENSAALLHDVVQLSHLATLACALAQDEIGIAEFDELRKQGPPTSAGTSLPKGDDTPPARSRPTAGGGRGAFPEPLLEIQQQNLDRFVLSLKNYERITPVQRPTILRNLASLAGNFEDVAHEHATAIAHYLLGIKTKPEHEAIKDTVPTITRWKGVRLALADQLASATLAKDELRQMLGAVLGRDIAAEEIVGTREGLRQELLRGVLLELPAETAPDPRDDVRIAFDLAEHALRESYRVQAKLLGIDAATLRGTNAVSPQLRLLVEQMASRLRPATLPPDDQQTLARLPHELAAVDFLGTNDLQRTVLLQRIWRRLVAMDLSQKKPATASVARQQVAAMDEDDSRAKQVVDQLRAGAAAELRLWMLSAPLGTSEKVGG